MERKMRVLLKVCKVLPAVVAGMVIGYQIRKNTEYVKKIRQRFLENTECRHKNEKTVENLNEEKSSGCFDQNIYVLRSEAEKALYQRCWDNIEASRRAGNMSCYLLTNESYGLPDWIKKNLLTYGLDLCCYNSHDGSYWCEAYWDRSASGKMREHHSIR